MSGPLEGMTLFETFEWLSKITNDLIARTTAWSTSLSATADQRRRALKTRRAFQQFSTRFGETWSRVTQSNRHHVAGDDFDGAISEVEQLLTEAAELEREISGEAMVAAVSETLSFETDVLERAAAQHRASAAGFLGLLICAAILAGWIILETFGLLDTGVRLVSAFPPGETRIAQLPWDHALTILGGRVAVVLLLGWLLSFLGQLHRDHSKQAIDYRDRIAGLKMLGPVLRVAGIRQRESAIDQLIRSNLSLEHNAFRALPRPSRRLSARDVERVLAGVSKAVQPIVDTLRSGKSS